MADGNVTVDVASISGLDFLLQRHGFTSRQLGTRWLQEGQFIQAHSAEKPVMCRLTESGKDTKRHAAKAKEWHKARKAKLEAVERSAEKAWPPTSSIRPDCLLPFQAGIFLPVISIS